MSKTADHISVMSSEVLEHLKPKEGDVFVDGTLGLAGHARLILERIGPKGRLVGLDRDSRSLKEAKANLEEFRLRCTLVHENFRHIDRVLKKLAIERVNGILLDLGISSFQLDDPQRGFSFKNDGPLDMRMDTEGHVSAFDLINSLSEKELASIIKEFGQERWANRIARNITLQRREHPIETTQELGRIVLRSMPRTRSFQKIHPATRTFQAFRIAVNRELEDLELVIDKCVGVLKPKGRLAIISFHSLEDRIVKQKFKCLANASIAKLIVKKPLRPTEEEAKDNPRARSARLRIIERV